MVSFAIDPGGLSFRTMSIVPINANKITLLTADNHDFEVDEAVAMEFDTVKTFFDENLYASDEPIPLSIVSSKCLSTIIEYCKFHLALCSRDDTSTVEDEPKVYDEELVKTPDNESLMELVLAVNYLSIKDMLDMLNQGIADRIKNKSVEYVRKFFRIENNCTPEEESSKNGGFIKLNASKEDFVQSTPLDVEIFGGEPVVERNRIVFSGQFWEKQCERNNLDYSIKSILKSCSRVRFFETQGSFNYILGCIRLLLEPPSLNCRNWNARKGCIMLDKRIKCPSDVHPNTLVVPRTNWSMVHKLQKLPVHESLYDIALPRE